MSPVFQKNVLNYIKIILSVNAILNALVHLLYFVDTQNELDILNNDIVFYWFMASSSFHIGVCGLLGIKYIKQLNKTEIKW